MYTPELAERVAVLENTVARHEIVIGTLGQLVTDVAVIASEMQRLAKDNQAVRLDVTAIKDQLDATSTAKVVSAGTVRTAAIGLAGTLLVTVGVIVTALLGGAA